jgi:Cu(I)-responsive transcriptional regulator
VSQTLAFHIGVASERSGVTAKMIRHYETLGLLGSVRRTGSGYRQYSEADVHVLRFIKRSRELGFSMAEIATLVGLWKDKRRASAKVKRIAQQHLDALQQRVAALQDMQRTLSRLIESCGGNERPDCPILDSLSGQEALACR